MNLQLNNISFRYLPQQNLFSSLSAELTPGRIHYLAGPNGSGKSTLLKVLGAYLKPCSGKVLFNGQDLAALDMVQRARQVGIVWQIQQPLWDFPVREIVMMLSEVRFPRWHKLHASERAIIDSALQKFDLLAMSNQLPRTLSGGELQRTMLAGAFALSPEIMLLDEPTSALDPAWRNRVIAHLEEYARDHIVLVVTHDLELIGRAGDALWMLDGAGNFYSGSENKMFSAELWSRIYGTACNIECADNGRYRISFD